jgi:RNA polymerase sigma factor (sigma-70 family)
LRDEHGTTHFALLLDRIRRGDPESKDDLVRDAYWRVHRRSHHILRGSFPNAAYLETDDVVSVSLEHFRRTLREGIDERFADPAGLFAYVDVIIRRAVIDEIRRRNGRRYRTQFPAAGLPDDLGGDGHQAASNGFLVRLTFEEMIEDLPEDEQLLINFRFIRELNDREIAELIGKDRSTVSRSIRRILLKLRAGIGEIDATDR